MDFAPPTTWVALKLLEGDELLRQTARLSDAQRARIRRAVDEYVARGQKIHPGIDSLTLVVDARYKYIEEILAGSGYRRHEHEISRSDRIDRIVTHKYLAFPIFFAVMALMFAVTFGPIGTALSNGTEALVSQLGAWAAAGLEAVHSPEWVRSLVQSGVIAGVGGVLVFLPQILLIFLFMSILEDSGYMARAAFITDRLLRRFGLSGRSFIPMLMGFGCTTTAIIAARGVENERDRRMTIMLTPFMSCGARLPVYGAVHRGFLPRPSHAGGAQSVRAGHGDDDRLRPHPAQNDLPRGRFAVPDGTAALSRAPREERAAPPVGSRQGFSDPRGHADLRHERADLVHAVLHARPSVDRGFLRCPSSAASAR